MQWTGDGGAGYGEEPHAGPGHGYAHGQVATGGTTVDTVTAEPAPSAADGPVFVTGPGHPAGAEWDSPHGDVITVPPTDHDEPGRPVAEPDTPESDPAPVFVDASGRRQRRVRRAAQLLVIPAACYVALLISTVLGGPTISAPFVPLPETPRTATPHATVPDSPSGAGHSAGSAGSSEAFDSPGPGARQTASGLTGRPTASTAPVATPEPTTATSGTTSPAGTATPAGTASPTATTATPSATPTTAHSTKGRTIASSHKPVK